MTNEAQTLKGKVLTGVVLSAKMKNTVIVGVDVIKRHPVYGKAVTHTRRLAVHVETVVPKEGDTVRIRETKPLSKTVHFVVSEIVEG